jgi:site-specific recombinase XerD
MIDPHAVEDILNACNSPKTRKLYGYCLNDFMTWYDLNKRTELNTSTLMAYRAKLTKSQLSASSINSNLLVAKKLACYQNQDDPMKVWSIERNVKAMPPNRVKARKVLTLEQIKLVLAGCHDGTVRGCRDEAMIALMFGAGLRKSEVPKLDLTDFDGMDLLIRQSKGRKTRYVPLPDWAIRRLKAWLGVRPPIDGEKAIFIAWSRGRMSERNIYAVFIERTQKAGFEGFHPHNARTSYVTHLLKLKNDIAVVSRLVGHSEVQTTVTYDLRGDEELRLAVNTFKLD